MNCNPFTLGHRYVIEHAAKECDHVYVFVLSEEQPPFPAADRLQLVKDGTQDLKNVTVFPTGPYLISAATFPTYFLKDRDTAVTAQCGLDIAVFSRYYIPKFGITHRYVGTEPTSVLTNAYNVALKAKLPIPVVEILRLESGSQPISASTLRSLLGTGQREAIRDLVPATTFDYLEKNALL
jgi:[citrate (pro-3S)-lyase] ligase